MLQLFALDGFNGVVYEAIVWVVLDKEISKGGFTL